MNIIQFPNTCLSDVIIYENGDPEFEEIAKQITPVERIKEAVKPLILAEKIATLRKRYKE